MIRPKPLGEPVRANALVCFVACLMAAPVTAEMPLMPPRDYALQVGDVTVRADFAARQTMISPADRPAWTIPAAPQMFSLSPDGDAILAIHTGKHVDDRTRIVFVATRYRNAPGGVTFRHLALSDLMPTHSIPLTEAGYRWLDGYEVTDSGWRLTFWDGKTALVAFD